MNKAWSILALSAQLLVGEESDRFSNYAKKLNALDISVLGKEASSEVPEPKITEADKEEAKKGVQHSKQAQRRHESPSMPGHGIELPQRKKSEDSDVSELHKVITQGHLELIPLIELALSKNRGVEIQKETLEGAMATRDIASASFDWNVSSSYTRTKDITAFTETQRRNLTLSGFTRDQQEDFYHLFNSTVSRLTRWGLTAALSADITRTEETDFRVAENDRGVWQLSIDIPLLKGFGREAAAGAEISANYSIESERSNLLDFCSSTCRDTILAYWDYRTSALLLSLSQQTEDRARVFLEETKELVKAKLQPETKIKQLQANLAQKKAQRIQTEFRVIRS